MQNELLIQVARAHVDGGARKLSAASRARMIAEFGEYIPTYRFRPDMSDRFVVEAYLDLVAARERGLRPTTKAGR